MNVTVIIDIIFVYIGKQLVSTIVEWINSGTESYITCEEGK